MGEWVLHGNSVGESGRAAFLGGASIHAHRCCVGSIYLLCGLLLQKGHAYGGCRSSGYMLETVLVTFPVVMIKHPDRLKRERAHFDSQFKVTLYHAGKAVTAATAGGS